MLLFINSFNRLNAELNPLCHLLALMGDHHILHVSRIRVKAEWLQYLLPHGLVPVHVFYNSQQGQKIVPLITSVNLCL